MYQLVIIKPWRYRDRKRGMQTLQPGRYSVPQQVPESVARLAVDQGMATLTRLAPPPMDTPAVQPAAANRKRPPRNKARGPAPENKSALG